MIKDGKITEVDGNTDVDLPSYDELKGSFNFSKSNMKNVVLENDCLTADVISASEFYGASIKVNDLKITVEYSESAILKLTVFYKTANSTVKTVYVFES